MPKKIDTWYGSRFVDCNIVTQLFYNGAGFFDPLVQFFNRAPNEFKQTSQANIVAVWKPKQLA